MSDTKKIGLMGGTFDPIHYGHLVLAEQVRSNLDLDAIYFVPSGRPPHKDGNKITDKNLRLAMVKLAIADNEYFKIFDYELKKEEKTFTVDTVKAFKDMIDSKAVLYFITGADQLMKIESWKEYEKLFEEIIFVGASRPGNDDVQLIQQIHYLKDNYHARILHVEVPALAISSTDIRNRIREGNSIKYLLPDRVEQFIIENKLYK
ncbi:MAG: nicotinate-nucleotide adenylyltransferase [Clostridiales bacterium]|nr:nicotinate-nucleotide adenylyltransferase [Clostridiales bacterium]